MTVLSSKRRFGPAERINMLIAIKIDDQGHSAQEQGKAGVARQSYINALGMGAPGGPRFRQDYLQYSSRICAEVSGTLPYYCQ